LVDLVRQGSVLSFHYYNFQPEYLRRGLEQLWTWTFFKTKEKPIPLRKIPKQIDQEPLQVAWARNKKNWEARVIDFDSEMDNRIR